MKGIITWLFASARRTAAASIAALALGLGLGFTASAQSPRLNPDLNPKAQRERAKLNEEVGKTAANAKKMAEKRKFDKAIKLQQEAVVKSLKANGPDDPFHLNLVCRLAQYNDSAGRFDESLALRQQVFQTATETMPPYSDYRLDHLFELALAYHDNGRDSLAIPMLEDVLRKLTVDRRATTPLAAKAERLYADYRMANAATPLDSIYANLFHQKALAAQYRVDHAPLDEHALNERALRTYYDSTDLFNAGRREEAVDSMKSAIDQWVLYDGPFGYSVGIAKKALGFYANILRNYPTAIQCFHESLFIHDYIGQSDDYDYSKTMSDLSRLYYFSGDKQGTFESSKNAYESFKSLICKNFASLSGQERAEFWDMCHVYFEKTLPSFALHVPDLTPTCYDAVLLSKGLLLNASTELRQLVLNSDDATLKYKYDMMRMMRRNIEDQLYRPECDRDTKHIESCLASAVDFEKQIVEACDRDGKFTASLSSSWQDVAAKLSPDEVAIEFLHLPIGGWDSRGYAALVLKNGDIPKMEYLCDEDEIKAINPHDYYETTELSQLIWEPLQKYTNGCSNIYFAPAGILYNVAIENLPSPKGGGYIADKADYHRLSSTRELVKERKTSDFSRAAVYGGLFYSPQQEAYFTATPEQIAEQNLTLSVDGMSYLPATLTEATSIAQRLKENPGRIVRLFTGSLGSESSFKSLSGSGYNLIHVATHGHYYSTREATFHRDLKVVSAIMSSDAQVAIPSEDRMLSRSGLYFAGANTYARNNVNPGIIDDGILTAKEISELDFRGLDLVVLSACETGLGDITGDGVYGLQRGFKKAGATSILMSLWKIDDEATSLLMNRFYSYLGDGHGKYDSLKRAQADLRNLTSPIGTQPYSSPNFWGAFVILDALD